MESWGLSLREQVHEVNTDYLTTTNQELHINEKDITNPLCYVCMYNYICRTGYSIKIRIGRYKVENR